MHAAYVHICMGSKKTSYIIMCMKYLPLLGGVHVSSSIEEAANAKQTKDTIYPGCPPSQLEKKFTSVENYT